MTGGLLGPTIFLPHKDGGVIYHLSQEHNEQNIHIILFMLSVNRKAVDDIFKFSVWLRKRTEPRTIDCQADALAVTPPCRYCIM